MLVLKKFIEQEPGGILSEVPKESRAPKLMDQLKHCSMACCGKDEKKSI